MIIIEGTDGIGKTYLARRLVKELEDDFPMVYSHLSRLPLSWQFPIAYEDHVRQFVVQDRFHMSEIVYTGVRGEPQVLLPAHYRLIDAWLREVGAVTVVLTADGDALRRHADEMYNEDAISRANVTYEGLVRGTCLYDYSPDFDIHHHSQKTTSFPGENDNLVHKILKLWITRQNELQQVTVRKNYDETEDTPKTGSDGGVREEFGATIDVQAP